MGVQHISDKREIVRRKSNSERRHEISNRMQFFYDAYEGYADKFKDRRLDETIEL